VALSEGEGWHSIQSWPPERLSQAGVASIAGFGVGSILTPLLAIRILKYMDPRRDDARRGREKV
jgi:hypothetical protein